MRVLIAPDSFTGTLSAVDAADAIARGWRAVAPDDDLDLAPLSDGGTGFVDVLSARLGGELVAAVVRGPAGRPTPAGVLLVGQTAYVESAQACGLHLLALDERDPTRTTTYGVGELVRVALNSGARSIVVGLGGSGTNDGGRGMLDALGADAELLRGLDLVAATDVDNPLVGIHGASAVFGPQKGATPDQVQRLDHELGLWARGVDAGLVEAPGAGAAGGLGFALLHLGARRTAGVAEVMDLLGLTGPGGRIADADLAVTGEGSFDSQSLRGKVPAGVAAGCLERAVPCVVVAGQVAVGRREAAAMGVTEAYSLAQEAGSVAAATGRAAEHLAAVAGLVARRWSRRG